MADLILPAVLTGPLPVTVSFAYDHAYRAVEVTRVWLSSEGHVILTGVDLDYDAYRSFRLDRIPPRTTIKKVKQ